MTRWLPLNGVVSSLYMMMMFHGNVDEMASSQRGCFLVTHDDGWSLCTKMASSQRGCFLGCIRMKVSGGEGCVMRSLPRNEVVVTTLRWKMDQLYECVLCRKYEHKFLSRKFSKRKKDIFV